MDWAMAARRTDGDRWGCGHVDGWDCGRELDGGGQAGAAAARWTEEPTAASCSRDDSRVASAAIRRTEAVAATRRTHGAATARQKVVSMSRDRKR